MVRIGEENFGAKILKVAVKQRLDGPTCTDGHECRSLYAAMRRL